MSERNTALRRETGKTIPESRSEGVAKTDGQARKASGGASMLCTTEAQSPRAPLKAHVKSSLRTGDWALSHQIPSVRDTTGHINFLVGPSCSVLGLFVVSKKGLW